MKFVQVMEFEGSADRSLVEIQKYLAAAGSETTVRKITLCRDRDNFGVVVQFIEFDSYEDALLNNELEVTEKVSAEQEQEVGKIIFRNLDVLEVIEV